MRAPDSMLLRVQLPREQSRAGLKTQIEPQISTKSSRDRGLDIFTCCPLSCCRTDQATCTEASTFRVPVPVRCRAQSYEERIVKSSRQRKVCKEFTTGGAPLSDEQSQGTSGSKRRPRLIYFGDSMYSGEQGTLEANVFGDRCGFTAQWRSKLSGTYKEPVLPTVSFTRGLCLFLRVVQYRLRFSRSPTGSRSSSPQKLLCPYQFKLFPCPEKCR